MPSGQASSPTSRPAVAEWSEQVREALVGLGWSLRQAEDTVEAIRPEAGDGSDVSSLLRAALRELGR